MPSPFPGMDPFIENQKWEDFHTSFISAIRDALVPNVRPKYVVDVEKRIYLERIDPEAAVCTIPYFEEHRETFITIRRGSPSQVVTVIELLSPTNKRKGSEGRDQYLEKVNALMKTKVSLVELDLLRGGERSTVSHPPPGDYFALVSKPKPRPLAEVYGWRWNDRLPRILIPLSIEDPEVPLDLQTVFDLVYDRAGYDYSLNCKEPVIPAFSDTDAQYVQSRFQGI